MHDFLKSEIIEILKKKVMDSLCYLFNQVETNCRNQVETGNNSYFIDVFKFWECESNCSAFLNRINTRSVLKTFYKIWSLIYYWVAWIVGLWIRNRNIVRAYLL
jgi:3-methyladenine DNA glycosylase AlkC